MQALAGTLRKRRNLSDIVGHAFNFYGADWRGFVTIGSGTIPMAVAGTLAGGLIENRVVWIVVTLALLVLSLGVYAIVEAAVVSHLLQIDSGNAGDEAGAYRAAWSKAAGLLKANYRLFFLVMLMFVSIVGIPFGFYSAIRWLFATHAIMIDGQTGANALSYSGNLVRGHWWRTFGRVLFVAVVIAVLSGAMTGLANAAPLLLYALVSAIVGAFTGPYFSIALTLMYFDLKLRKAEEAPAT